MTTRSIVRGCLTPALALTLLASAGCKRDGQDNLDREAARTGEGALDQTKRQTGEAYDEAKEAHETARDKTQEAMTKGEEVIDQREDLTEAQKEMQQREQEAQQAQQQAKEAAEGAQQQGQMAPEQDKAAPEQDKAAPSDKTGDTATTTTEPTTTGAIIAQGTVESASQDEVVIKNDAGATLRLDVDPQATTVLKDGKPATLTDLEQGTKVRVEYRTERGQQVATRIEAGTPVDEG